MAASVGRACGRKWSEYYRKFPYFSDDTVRNGCYPRVFMHEPTPGKAVVLCHGLTDSPHFLNAIADEFHHRLGYDVYLPLLQGHGLKEPNGMAGVRLEEWKENVGFAVDAAARNSKRVSIGGLSTGGTLSLHAAITHPLVNGDLYLFSAALDLAGGPGGVLGDIKERLLRTFLADLLDRDQPLIGRNPFRYCRMDMDGARELARLIEETDKRLKHFGAKAPFPKRVFAAHSESDTTADIRGIYDLREKTPPDRFRAFIIPKAANVSHASLVLESPIAAVDAAENEAPLEKANPLFAEMMTALRGFEEGS